jgi:hypothetical protein
VKLFLVSLIVLILTGCAVFCPYSKQALSQDQQNFALAFEEFQKTNRLDGLRKLRADFPDSVWASRAETIILYSQELDQRKDQNEKLRELEEQQAAEIEELKILNRQLTEKIEQFKSLLIQSEQHPQ